MCSPLLSFATPVDYVSNKSWSGNSAKVSVLSSPQQAFLFLILPHYPSFYDQLVQATEESLVYTGSLFQQYAYTTVAEPRLQ